MELAMKSAHFRKLLSHGQMYLVSLAPGIEGSNGNHRLCDLMSKRKSCHDSSS